LIQHALSAVDPILLRALDLRPRQRVLDVACGTGDPALWIARWIGPSGKVVGIDVARPMIDVARRRAALMAIRNARFQVADAEHFRLTGPRFHRIVSRFGLMFVDDVPRTLAAMHRALAPRGRIAFAVWAEAERSTALTIATRAMQPFLRESLPDPEAGPHPMRFGRPARLVRIMRSAGFRSIRIEELTMAFAYQSPEQYVMATLEISSAARGLMRTLTPRQQRLARERMFRAAARHRHGRLIRLPAVARVVSARR
jgi:SAM-dependent methyltransferase